jgi:hypothetical protein
MMRAIQAPTHAGAFHAISAKALTRAFGDATANLLVMIHEVEVINVGSMAGEIRRRPLSLDREGAVWCGGRGGVVEQVA